MFRPVRPNVIGGLPKPGPKMGLSSPSILVGVVRIIPAPGYFALYTYEWGSHMFCLVEDRTGKIMARFTPSYFEARIRGVYHAISYWCPATSIRNYDEYSIRWME